MQLIIGNPVNSLALASIAWIAAVLPGFKLRYQRPAAVARIEVNIAAKRPVVSRVFDQKRLVSTLVEMSGPSIAFRIPVRLAREPMLHASGQIGFRGLDQRMDMIWHPTIGNNDPSATIDLVDQPLGEPLIVSIVVKESSPTVSTSDDVVVGAGELNSWGARHRQGAGI